MENKTYLGDGVYAEYKNYQTILTTSNDIKEINRIVLEVEVLDNLNCWLRKLFFENKLGGK